ncbi:MAG: DUF2127 domain-containing protein [Burkholderiales bacterium]|nr:DUF2127 domain-containing protein [Burkholderiales bacterium]
MHGLRAIALFEAAKGALALVAALSFASLLHHDLAAMAQALSGHLHLNPAHHLAQMLQQRAGQLEGLHVGVVLAGAALYAGVRFAEAWGLWWQRRWAEALGAASGAIYVPFELRELIMHPGPWPAALLAANLAVVAVLLRALWLRRRTPLMP